MRDHIPLYLFVPLAECKNIAKCFNCTYLLVGLSNNLSKVSFPMSTHIVSAPHDLLPIFFSTGSFPLSMWVVLACRFLHILLAKRVVWHWAVTNESNVNAANSPPIFFFNLLCRFIENIYLASTPKKDVLLRLMAQILLLSIINCS